MRIAIATDAWIPQVNGVVRTLTTTVNQLLSRGHDVELITPDKFRNFAMPGYSEIRLAMLPGWGVQRSLNAFAPDIVHIATEGPIGWSTRRWCKDHKVPFTTAFHTRFPDYAAVRTGLSPDHFWPIMRRFHAPSRAVLVSTQSLADELAGRGIGHTRIWSRGIDTAQFHADGPHHPDLADLPGPILLSVGRVAPEKNLEAFLRLDRPGTKVIVGDGPSMAHLQRAYPDAIFMGARHGAELAAIYRSADCFVFPSLTDTFGLVIIEALACGVPVAAYPVSGPRDIIGADGMGPCAGNQRLVGCVDRDLGQAVSRALSASRTAAAQAGQYFDWDRCTDQFLLNLEDVYAPNTGSITEPADLAIA